MSLAPTTICYYRVKAGLEAEFTQLLRRHWPTLHSLGLVSEEEPRHYRGMEADGSPFFVEIFSWKTSESAGQAHQIADVMAIWEPMDKLTEARDGRPNMEFPDVQPISLD